MEEPPSRLKKRPCSTLGRKMPACDQPPYEELKQPSLPCFSIVSRMALAVRPSATSQLTCTKGSLPRSSGFVLPERKPSRYDLRTMGPAMRVLSYVRAMTPSVSRCTRCRLGSGFCASGPLGSFGRHRILQRARQQAACGQPCSARGARLQPLPSCGAHGACPCCYKRGRAVLTITKEQDRQEVVNQ